MGGAVETLRDFASMHQGLYGWVVYSLPDGLWLFAYLLIIDAIWNRYDTNVPRLFITVLPFLALTSEFMQALRLMPGVFDWGDVASYLLAIFLFITIKLLK